ncbi:hypothetical protein CEUSTIGMA_g8135.t1 [Chlamydomonas eustigma]|uniref:Mitochondrial import inner membrane translocase subunit TIM23 n=1 Tax=Chlamydomonas eustigma TaxID=1157962 RepID=A0A250XD68_9CHLO|nr:hypothetical protein CEUSTIGMA_g8135.t1 [Chlamydomonas eustigma]|eukprot:GAX80700.1 hypothetical protein CEUSTIGMA_g8135.t1 [Chlamydomonas eustigma]
MGYLDRFLGKRHKDVQEDVTNASTESTSSSTPEIMLDTSASSSSSSSYGPPSISSGSLSTPINTLMPSFPSATSGAGSSQPSARLYDPYEGISQAVGVRKQVFKLPQQPEFLFEEEANVRRRGWGENLQFYVGLGYILGGGSGVGAGLYRFATIKPDVIGPDTVKLKANRFLNSIGMYARPLANNCGILGLYFSAADSIIFNQLDKNGLPESMSSILAGGVSGAIFRLPRGPRSALIAGAVGTVAGTGIVALRTIFPAL